MAFYDKEKIREALSLSGIFKLIDFQSNTNREL